VPHTPEAVPIRFDYISVMTEQVTVAERIILDLKIF
ncbi:MAG: hypothetical protein ACI976_001666, partial [Aureispira sp.]